MAKMVTRSDVIWVLMHQSHRTYMRQKTEDLEKAGLPKSDLDPTPTKHDLERAVDGLERLEVELGIEFPLAVPEK